MLPRSMHNAFILAAGFGTRLRPLTEHLPKPLVPVCGVPMLAYSLALLKRHGLDRAIVNAHWLPEHLRAWEGLHEGVHVTLSVETPDILGTGGGLKRVADQLAETFAVVNGDILTNVDLGALLDAVRPGSGAFALRYTPDAATRYGIVAADATGTVVKMREIAAAEPEGEVDATTHFTGIHAMDRTALELVPDGFACVVRSAYKALVPRRRVGAIRHDGLWLDVGDPRAYLDANLAALAGDLPLPLDPFSRAGCARSRGEEHGDPSLVRDTALDGDIWIGRHATIGPECQLRDTIIGAGAKVPAGTTLVDSVVWDGCEVPRGSHRGVVVFPGGVLQVERD